MSFDLATVLGFVVVSGGLLWVLLLVSRLVRPSAPGAVKESAYECGELPFGPAWFNFNSRFYVVALVFVAFDVQVALAIPVAVVLRGLLAGPDAGFAFAGFFGYLGLMMLTLAYVWRRGDLSWVRDMTRPVGGSRPAGVVAKPEVA